MSTVRHLIQDKHSGLYLVDVKIVGRKVELTTEPAHALDFPANTVESSAATMRRLFESITWQAVDYEELEGA